MSRHGITLQWRHNGCDCVSNHQPHDCLFNRLFGLRSNKTSKLHVTGLCTGNSPEPVNSPHKWPVMRKMFPFDDVIMTLRMTVPMLRKSSGHNRCLSQRSSNALIFFMFTWTSCWTNSWDTGELPQGSCDVTVMWFDSDPILATLVWFWPQTHRSR